MDLKHFLCFAFTTCALGFSSAPDDQKEVVEAGKTAVLKCNDSSIGKVDKVTWIRKDLGTNLYVFFYRENRPYENIQHPSFRGRVELSDPQIKHGNVSLTLYNTNTNDTGTYECHVVGRHAGRSKRAVSEVQHVVQLTVKPSSQSGGQEKDGAAEPIPGLSVLVVVTVVLVLVSVAAVVGLLIKKRLKKGSYMSDSEALNVDVLNKLTN
ncbi:coxsackievirus and adenovirus receptor homolog [Oreochromis aureus]|uniref:coxsackievirus and adenovirus receptor homolog n=1 Tax=Oreochromis aureus TaxID=47969 RepID=UPI0012BC7C03|nr:coxsackievirus and adenovirus receptor homolog [Oreochromis aureus]